jgi:hypothetical protein
MNAPHIPPDTPTPTFDPWEACARLGIEIIREPLRKGRGYTDGSHRIWLHDRLTLCEERSTLTHEVVHVTQGHNGKQPPEVEELVRKVTARWLVPWHVILAGLEAPAPLEQIARHLCVTPGVVLDRIAYATCGELAMLESEQCASLAA